MTVYDSISGYGIHGYGNTNTACSNNVVAGFSTAITSCLDAGNNSLLVHY